MVLEQLLDNRYMCMVLEQLLDNNFKIAVVYSVRVHSVQIKTKIFICQPPVKLQYFYIRS